jgi:uncharacterized protein YoxC
MDTQTLLIIFVGLTGAAVLLQACVLLALFISIRKTAKSVSQATEDLKSTAIPMIHRTRELMERISPQVVTVSTSLAELSTVLNKETKEIKFSVSEMVERVNKQTARLDAMLTHGLDRVERTGNAIESAVAAPVRHANGVVAAIKAVIDTYRTASPRNSNRHSPLEDSEYSEY